MAEIHLSLNASTDRIKTETERALQIHHGHQKHQISDLGKVITSHVTSHLDQRFDALQSQFFQPAKIEASLQLNVQHTGIKQHPIRQPLSGKGDLYAPRPIRDPGPRFIGTCRCTCHTSTTSTWRISSPKHLFGSIAVDYRSQSVQKCTSPSCCSRQHSCRNIRITYALPDWLLRATICVFHSSSLYGNPQLVIRIQYQIPGEQIHPQSIFGRVQHHDIEGVKTLLAEGLASVNDILGATGLSPLTLAIGCRNIEMVRLLIQAGADPYQEAPNDQGSPLSFGFLWYLSASNGADELAELLPISNYIADMDFPPLHRIVMGNLHMDLAEALENNPSYRKDINSPGQARQTPLDIAVHRGGDHTAMRLLIAHGANIEAISGGRRTTALHRACLKGDYEAVKILLEAGASVDTRERHKWNALACAATCPIENPSKLLSLLLRYGADVNAECGFGWQPLSQAIIQGTLAAVAWLVDHGADIDHRDLEGDTALAEAIFQGWSDKAEFLIRRGADLGTVSNEGRTLLHYLARDAEVEMMEVFRAARVSVIDPGKRDKGGKTAMMMYRERRPDKELEAAFEGLVGSVERGFWGDGEETEDEFEDARETQDG
jgi:ankyrin repeat protein